MKEWEDEHETAEEMDHLACQTVIILKNKPEVPITMISKPCFDTLAADEFNEFLKEIHNWIPTSGTVPSYYFSQTTAVWPQFLGLGLLTLSALLGAAYYFNTPARYLRYVHRQ